MLGSAPRSQAGRNRVRLLWLGLQGSPQPFVGMLEETDVVLHREVVEIRQGVEHRVDIRMAGGLDRVAHVGQRYRALGVTADIPGASPAVSTT